MDQMDVIFTVYSVCRLFPQAILLSLYTNFSSPLQWALYYKTYTGLCPAQNDVISAMKAGILWLI